MPDYGFAYGLGLFEGGVGAGGECAAAGCGGGGRVRLEEREGVDAGEEFVG